MNLPRISFLLILALAVQALVSCAATKDVRYPATRWLKDDDRIPIKQPKTRREYSIADGVEFQFFYQIERLVNIPMRFEHGLHYVGFSTLEEAHNTNNFDEVADSTWFTNRLNKKNLSLEEILEAGPKGNGPEMQGPWTITQAKYTGVTPGFLIKDATGQRFFIKFDPVDYPELTTAAEVIGTRLMYALGYNVAQTYIVEFDPAILKVSEKLSSKDPKDKGYFNQEKLDAQLRKLPAANGGKLRAVASRFIEGDILGPFPARGKRRGDKNDRISHEHRRELRGYRYFSGFISNPDVREGNGLDTFIKTGPDEKGYVKHYMLDFGNALGSSSVKPKSKNHLYDYVFNYGQVLGSTVTLGGYRPRYEKAEDPGMPSVGLFESKRYIPQNWRPHYPYPAFQNTTDRDGFWATKILTRLTDDQIAAIVKQAHYTSPRAEAYVTQTLIERRNKIRDRWFSIMNPLDEFQLAQDAQGLRVAFQDLAIRSGMRPAGSATYRFRILQEKGAYEVIGWTETSDLNIQIPQSAVDKLHAGKPYLLQVQTRAQGEEFFGPTIDLILRRDATVQLLGLNRRYRT